MDERCRYRNDRPLTCLKILEHVVLRRTPLWGRAMHAGSVCGRSREGTVA